MGAWTDDRFWKMMIPFVCGPYFEQERWQERSSPRKIPCTRNWRGRCAHLTQKSKPDELEKLDREIMTPQIELLRLKNESDVLVWSGGTASRNQDTLKEKRKEAAELTDLASWCVSIGSLPIITLVDPTNVEHGRLQRVKELKQRLEDAKYELEVVQRQGQYDKASRLRFAIIPELQCQLLKESEQHEEDTEGPLSMLHDRVTSNSVSRVVARATGIPVQNLLKGEQEKQVHVSPFRLVDEARLCG